MYIVFEGIVGSGKSTQSKRLVEYLRTMYPDREILHVREPWSTPIAEDIRHLCQGKEWEDEDMHPLTNAYLYAAARAQTLHTIVYPALDRWAIVISDRSFLSSCAYQGEAQWLGINTILWVNKSAVGKRFPDSIFYMDIDVDVALARTFDAAWDKWEKKGKEFFQSIVRGYDKCEKWKPIKDRFIRIDARGSQDEIFEEIISKLNLG